MKIKTWIKYLEGYLPPRCRKTRYETKEEFYNATLKEAKLSDMELAFEDNSYSGKGKIYSYKGKLWSKVKAPNKNDEYVQDGKYKTALESLIWWNEHGSKFFVPYRFGHGEKDSGRTDAIKEVRSYMSKYLLVDGELYGLSSEPMYCIYTFGLGHNHGGTHLSVDYHYNPNIASSAYFNALQGKEAVKEAKKTALNRGDTESVKRITADIVVHKPELVKRSPHKQHKGAGSKLLKDYEEIIEASPNALTAGLLILASSGG